MLTKERLTDTIGNNVRSTQYADCTAAYEAVNTAWRAVDSLREKIELSESIRISREQFERGEFISHDELMGKVRRMLKERSFA